MMPEPRIVATLIKIVNDGQGKKRQSGYSSFPAPKKQQIGKKVVIEIECITWDGCLGHFADDSQQKRYAFWSDELSKPSREKSE